MEKKYGTGWMPDYPDCRDFSLNLFHKSGDHVTPEEKMEMQASSQLPSKDHPLFFDLTIKETPSKVDLREYCSEVRDQGSLGACTAFAGVSLVEYYEKRTKQVYVPASTLFLYKATRNYMRMTGDTGANPRSTMAAMVLFGIPPEKYHEYDQNRFDEEPAPFLYSFAQNYKSVKFFRHDIPGIGKSEDTMRSLKLSLANGIPAMCGFSLFSSHEQSKKSDKTYAGRIPFPGRYDARAGGHAISVFGYDDSITITNDADKNTTTGAFLIKNSWGKSWGIEGYGWLPYEYLYKGLAIDWWSIIKHDWVDTDEFENITPKS